MNRLDSILGGGRLILKLEFLESCMALKWFLSNLHALSSSKVQANRVLRGHSVERTPFLLVVRYIVKAHLCTASNPCAILWRFFNACIMQNADFKCFKSFPGICIESGYQRAKSCWRSENVDQMLMNQDCKILACRAISKCYIWIRVSDLEREIALGLWLLRIFFYFLFVATAIWYNFFAPSTYYTH